MGDHAVGTKEVQEMPDLKMDEAAKSDGQTGYQLKVFVDDDEFHEQGTLSRLDDYLDPSAWEVGWEVKCQQQEYKFKLRHPKGPEPS